MSKIKITFPTRDLTPMEFETNDTGVMQYIIQNPLVIKTKDGKTIGIGSELINLAIIEVTE